MFSYHIFSSCLLTQYCILQLSLLDLMKYDVKNIRALSLHSHVIISLFMYLLNQ